MNFPLSSLRARRPVYTLRLNRYLHNSYYTLVLGADRILLVFGSASRHGSTLSTRRQSRSTYSSASIGHVLRPGHRETTPENEIQQEPLSPRATRRVRDVPGTEAPTDQIEEQRDTRLKDRQNLRARQSRWIHPSRHAVAQSIPSLTRGSKWRPWEEAETKESKERRLAKKRKQNAAILRLTRGLQTISPSAILVKTLKDAGLSSCLPYEATGKFDLSYGASWNASSVMNHSFTMFSQRLSLQSILAAYLRATCTDDQGESVWKSEDRHKYLEKKHFEFDDVASWSTIIAAETSDKAAANLLRLARASSDPGKFKVNKAPVFLVMFLLRRSDMTSTAFKLLLQHCFDRLTNVKTPSSAFELGEGQITTSSTYEASGLAGTGNYPNLNASTCSLLLVRLLRMAGKFWPESIGIFFEPFISYQFKLEKQQDHEFIKKQTFMYNRFLHLLSEPISREPFQNIDIIQKAQLSLLRQMTEFQPALPVNREGYHAMVRTHLKRPKSQQEREWAHLQSKSWPPWKEDKYGLDADKGIEHGMSRATQTLSRAVEAGYPPGTWEKVAGILAGWDTDSSPTVHRRTQLAPNMNRRGALIGIEPRRTPDSDAQANNDATYIWSARIEATRTLDEAWACFLSYKQGRKRWSHMVCYTMFKKIIHARRYGTKTPFPNPKTMYDYSRPQLTPGDSWHVWQASQNPRERPYLSEELPNEHDFMNDIVRHNVSPRDHFLAFALLNAENLGVGFQYLHISNLTDSVKSTLMGKHQRSWRKDPVPSRVLASYVQLLCSSDKPSDADKKALIETPGYQPEVAIDACGSLANHAFDLLIEKDTKYAPAWTGLFHAIVRRGETRLGARREHPTEPDKQDDDWKAAMNILAEMHNRGIVTDFQQLTDICLWFAKAVTGSDGLTVDRSSVYVNQLKKIFLRIASGSSITYRDTEPTSPDSPPVLLAPTESDHQHHLKRSDGEATAPAANSPPQLINVPRPAHLHGLVRALGKAGDFAGVVDLLRWMAAYAPELQAKMRGHRNAEPQLRHTLTAARVILERWRPAAEFQDGRGREGTDGLVEQARSVVASQEEWMGPWPDEDECDTYCVNDVGPKRDLQR